MSEESYRKFLDWWLEGALWDGSDSDFTISQPAKFDFDPDESPRDGGEFIWYDADERLEARVAALEKTVEHLERELKEKQNGPSSVG